MITVIRISRTSKRQVGKGKKTCQISKKDRTNKLMENDNPKFNYRRERESSATFELFRRWSHAI